MSLEAEEKKLIKNKKALAAGIIPALFIVLYGNELLQLLTAEILGATKIGMNFNYLFITAGYKVPPDLPNWRAYIILLTPVISSLFQIQAVSLFLSKVPLGFKRYALMLFQLVILGYMMFYILIGALGVGLKLDWNTDIQKFTEYLGVDYPGNLLIVFLMLFIIAIFLQFNARRISVFINK